MIASGGGGAILSALLLTRAAFGIVGGEPPSPGDTRFDCVGAIVKLESTPGSNFCSGTLIAPNMVLMARHCLDTCGGGSNCVCGVSTVPSTTYIVRFRRLLDGSIGTPGTGQYEVPIQTIHVATQDCAQQFAIGVLAWDVTHVQPAVIDLTDECHPTGMVISTEFGEFFLAGWGQDETETWPLTLRVGVGIGNTGNGWKGADPRESDSGGALMLAGSCGRMQLVSMLTATNVGVQCSTMSTELSDLIPQPPACSCSLTADELPDPSAEGRVTATAILSHGSLQIDQHVAGFPGATWHPCDGMDGRCAEGSTVLTSAGLSQNFTDAGACWRHADAGCYGGGSFDLSVTDRLEFNLNIDASHSTGVSLLSAGGGNSDLAVADSAFGCPANSEPFRIDIPFIVAGADDPVLRVIVTGYSFVDLGPPPEHPPIPPTLQPIEDVRLSWDLFQDLDEDGSVGSADIQVAHEECHATGFQILGGLSLRTVPVSRGYFVFRIQPVVDVRVWAQAEQCSDPDIAGDPPVSVQLRVTVSADSY